MGGDTEVQAPQPTSEEVAIQREQLTILKEQRAEQELFKPLIMQQMGLVEEDGTLRRMTAEERTAVMTPSEIKQQEIIGLQQERQVRGLKGEIPVSEATSQRKSEEFRSFKEAMSRAGNPITGDTPETATSQTTAGIQSLSAFKKRWGLLEEAERRGELTAGTSALLSTLGTTAGLGQQKVAQFGAFPQRQAGLFQQYGQALQPYQFQRGLQFQATQQTALNKAQQRAGLMQAIGTAVGTAGGLAIACWVAEELFGTNHIKTHLARLYASTTDTWFTRLYRKYGKSWAKWLSNHKWAKPIVKPIWEYMAYKGGKLWHKHFQILTVV